MTSNLQVRRVERHEWKKATDALAASFAADPVAHYLTACDGNSPEQARALDLKIFEYIVYAHLLRGEVLTVGDFDAIACWVPPYKNIEDLTVLFQSGMWRLYYQLGKESRARYFDELVPKLHNTKAKVLGDRDLNSWYLMYIGVRPEARGKGLSRLLIQHVTDRADKDGVVCYLESSTRANVPIYERFGFKETTDVVFDRAEEPITLHCMVREPKLIKDDSDD